MPPAPRTCAAPATTSAPGPTPSCSSSPPSCWDWSSTRSGSGWATPPCRGRRRPAARASPARSATPSTRPARRCCSASASWAAGRASPYAAALARLGLAELTADGESAPPDPADLGMAPSGAFSAKFVEVRVDRDLGLIRIARIVTVVDGGRILNEKLARSQIVGGTDRWHRSGHPRGDDLRRRHGPDRQSDLRRLPRPRQRRRARHRRRLRRQARIA